MDSAQILTAEQLVRETYPGIELGVEDGMITTIKLDGKTYSLHTIQNTDDPATAARNIIDMVRDFHYAQGALKEVS